MKSLCLTKPISNSALRDATAYSQTVGSNIKKNMSRKKNLIQLLESLEKPEFDEVVKTYLKEEYGFERIANTDGKDDTGIDIKVFDFQDEKLQFQLTTQKSKTSAEKRSFDKKLNEDLEKAKTNRQDYGYSDKLFFFYSYCLTNKVIRDYEKTAFKDYSINLELIDANRLAEEAENLIPVQRILYEKSKLHEFKVRESIFDDDNENLIFDLLSFGKPSEFKIQIIEGFVLKSIFDNPSLSSDEIKNYCETKFKVEENDVFYNKLLARLQTSKRIKKNPEINFF
jgi:cell division protein YceG involved in septum cleavage